MEWINFDKQKPCENQEVYYKFPEMGEDNLLIGKFHFVGEGYLIMSEVGIIPISCMKPAYWKPILDQPERSKREDIEDLGHEFVTVGCTNHRFCTKSGEEDHVIKSKMMRCSEHCGNTVSWVQ